MPELDGLPTVSDIAVTDDDLLLLFENGAGTDKSRKITITQLMQNVARDGGTIALASSTITALTATTASVATLTVATRVILPSGSGISNVRYKTESVAVPGMLAGAGATVDVTIAGVVSGDIITATAAVALPNGLIVQPWISATNTVKLQLFNSSGSTITAANYGFSFMAITPYVP